MNALTGTTFIVYEDHGNLTCRFPTREFMGELYPEQFASFLYGRIAQDKIVIMAVYGGASLDLEELHKVVHQPQENNLMERARKFQRELDRQLSEHQDRIVEMRRRDNEKFNE